MGSPGNWGSAWERPADATARGKGGGGAKSAVLSTVSLGALMWGDRGVLCTQSPAPGARSRATWPWPCALADSRAPPLARFPRGVRGPRAVPRPCSSTSVSPRLGSKRPGPEGPGAQKHARQHRLWGEGALVRIPPSLQEPCARRQKLRAKTRKP